MIGSTELLVIVVVIMVLFGASAIPKFARSIGQAKAEFEKGMKDGRESASKKQDDESNAKS